jgi:hypothetical protein
MAGPIYKLYVGKRTEAAYQLTQEETLQIYADLEKVFGEVGGKSVIHCRSNWSSERWHFFGIEEFPDIDAVQKYEEAARQMDWYRYVDSMSVLGIKSEG